MKLIMIQNEIVEKNGKKFSTFLAHQLNGLKKILFFSNYPAWEKKLLEFYDKNKNLYFPFLEEMKLLIL